jgi:hypothetical protein
VVEDSTGYFYLNIDGGKAAAAVKRAIWFRTKFVQDEGLVQKVEEDRIPRVRFTPNLKVPQDAPAELRIEFEVDNPPPKARLSFELQREDQGQFLTVPGGGLNVEAKERYLGFDWKGNPATLRFEAYVKDWTKVIDVAGMRGKHFLVARLLDAAGNKADEFTVRMELDDRPPQGMGIAAQPQISRGETEIEVVASAAPSPRVQAVTFLAGPKSATDADFVKAEQDGKATKGDSIDNEGRKWKAKLKVPADVIDTLVITARFKPVAGLMAVFPTEVKVVDPPSAAKDKTKTAKEAPKPGSIDGTVTIAGRPQPDLLVYLFETDPNTKKPVYVDQKKTTDEGTYKFKDIPAKTYLVYCIENVHGRNATKTVTVKPGESVTVDLKLLQ